MSYYAAGGFLEDISEWTLRKVAPPIAVDIAKMAVDQPYGSIGAFKRGALWLRERLANTTPTKAAQEEAWATTPPAVPPATRRHRASTRRTRRTRRWRPGLPLNPRYRTRGRRVTDLA